MEASALSWSSDWRLISLNCLGLIGVLATIRIPMKIYDLLLKNNYQVGTKMFKLRFSTLMTDINISNALRIQYTSVYLFRRIIFAAILVMVESKASLEITLLLSTVVGMGLWNHIVRPFVSWASSFLAVFNEALTFSLIMTLYLFLYPSVTSSSTSIIGYMMVSIVLTAIISNWSLVIAAMIHQIAKKSS